MKVISTNLGEKKTLVYKGKEHTTGIFKKAVDGPIFLGVEDVVGDNVINRKHHGGVNQAVYAYGENHYPFWKELYPNLDWEHGFFGENITLSEIDETQINIGDIYELGEAVLEVSHKVRQPCSKLGIRFDNPAIIKQFWNETKTGIYFKVINTGHVQVGDQLELLQKGEGLSLASTFADKRVVKGKN